MTHPKHRHIQSEDDFQRKPPAAKQTTYVVKSGDSLSKIAKEQLGDADRWTEIAEMNKATLPDPNLLRAGQELKLPAK